MRPDRFTTTAQQALADAQADAGTRQHAEITPLHLLGSLLADKSGPTWSLLAKAGADAGRAATFVQSELGRLPTVQGATALPSRSLMAVMTVAEGASKKLSDAYVSSEHLLLGLIESGGQGSAKELLSLSGVDRGAVERAIRQTREASGVSS
ncbi:MAG: hypothetical protein K2X32_14400, partial [Phycisphaerales bacterium]|nr:hypothetical protein [Phycisphaerales bacterium]